MNKRRLRYWSINVKGFFLFILIVITQSVYAQLDYTFSSSSGTFTNNASPTTIHAAGTDDVLSSAINIGFTFNYECTDYTQIKVSTNGWLTFNTALTSSTTTNNLATSTTRPVLAPLWDDLQVYTGGAVNYKLTGSSPNQVLTVEWSVMEWNYGSSGDVISFQVKLYETTNVIEFIYSQGADVVNSGSASIGISGTTSGLFYSLDGTGASPNASTVTETTNLSTKPATGQVYTFTPAAACSGTPNAGTATPSPATVCNGSTSTISLSGYSSGCGISYQWQSASAIGGPYSDISGATLTTYEATVTADTYYRCITTCSNGGGTNTSSVATVTLDNPSNCYCSSTFSNTTDEYISNVTFNTIDNDSGQEGAGSYGDYTSISTDVVPGTLYTISVTFVSTYTQDIFVWIDWNQDGVFNTSDEQFQVCDNLSTPTTHTLGITIPLTATTGTTRMRVMTYEFDDPGSCETGTYGETEDYTINITGGCTAPAEPGAITNNSPQCAGTGIAFTQGACSEGTCYWQTTSSGTSTASSASTYTTATTAGLYTMYVRAYDVVEDCWSTAVSSTGTIYGLPAVTVQPSNASLDPGNSTTFSITATGESLTYQWQVDEGSGWSNITTAGSDPTYADWTTATLQVNSVVIGNDGYQYRCVVTGTCSPTATSNAATLTVSQSYCAANSSACDEYISNVVCGSISNNSAACSVGGYADYTAQSTSMYIGTGYAITVTNGDPYSSDQCGIWIDWNQDYDFDDAGETITVTGTPGVGPYTATITPPSGATAGSTTMRIRICYSTGLSACGTASYGEVEDYTINVTSPCTAPAAPGAITNNSPQCAGTGITFTQGSCTGGCTCYWQTSSDGTSTANSASNYTTATTAGSYTMYVRAYDPVETCWSTAVSSTGTVNALPAITSQPSSVSINSGTSTSFSVTATGAGLTYQWQVNTGSGWNNITVAGSNPTYANWTTATLNVNTVVVGNDGYQYRCIVSGTCTPSVTSNSATLSVSTCSSFDDCACATALTVGASCSFTTYSNATATASSGETAPGCGNYLGGDVWFTVTVPASGHLIFDSDEGVITDGGMAIYSGSCGALTLIECDDDDSNNGLMPSMDVSGLTPSSTIYIRFWEYGNNNNGTFDICVYDPGLGPCASITTITACAVSQTAASGGGSGVWNTGICGTGTPGNEMLYVYTPTQTSEYYLVVTSASSYMTYGYQEGLCQSVGWTCIARTNVPGTFGPFNLTAGNDYYFLVDDEDASASTHQFYIKCPEEEGTYYHPTENLQGTYLGACMVNTCVGTYKDDGGSSNYSNVGGSIYRTFCPDRAGKCLKADFTSMDINYTSSSDYDYIEILNGPTQGSPTFWWGTGTLASPITGGGTFNEPFVSTDQSGCISFWFYSNSANNAPGWSIDFSCEDCGATQTNNDCSTATAICGATNVNSASPGPGLMSVCGGCNLSENYSSWYYFEITESGRLDLNIKPEDFFEDYDVSLYQASDCSDLGDPVRCSYAMAPDYCYNISDDPAYYISRVQFNTIDNSSTYNSSYYHSNYTETVCTNVDAGSSYNLTVTTVGAGQEVAAWFDWDKDMLFEAGEYYNLTTNPYSITIPLTARPGKTAFRIYSVRVGPVTSGNACSNYSDGEIEDYCIYIDDGTHCSNGVKDADEIGVDCGGADCVLCDASYWPTNTGMNSVATDVSEDVTGDSWINGIAVNAGDSYYLMVNNWSPNANGFDLIWNFTEGGAMDCSILPIELLTFDAIKYEKGAKIVWSTVTEINNDYFTVLKSYDSHIWKALGTVSGEGNSNELNDYAFYDSEPLNQLTYYRLKQTDFDGKFSYSEIVALDDDGNNNKIISFYDGTQIIVDFYNLDENDYAIMLTDYLGRILYNEKIKVVNKYERVQLPVKYLSSNIYNILIINDKSSYSNRVYISN